MHLVAKGSLAVGGVSGGWTIKVESHPLQAPPRSARVLSSSAAPLPASTSASCAMGGRTVPTALTKVEGVRHRRAAKLCVPTPASRPHAGL